MKGGLSILLLAACVSARAASVVVNGVTVEVPDIPIQTVSIAVVPVAAIPVNAIEPVSFSRRSIPGSSFPVKHVRIRAISADPKFARWQTLYRLLATPGLYKGNHFAVEARRIEAQAQADGVTDELLAKARAFAAALKQAESQ